MGRVFSLMPNFKLGSFFDGSRMSIGTYYFWSLSSTRELSGFYEFNSIKLPDRDREFTAHIVRLKVLATFTKKLSFSAFVQYNGASDVIVANIKLRYNPQEGNDLYLVCNHGVNTKRSREIPRIPVTGNRAIMIKYT